MGIMTLFKRKPKDIESLTKNGSNTKSNFNSKRLSVYEQKLPEPKYEVFELLGMGSFSAFFSIKGHPRLGVKIIWNRYPEVHEILLENEYNKSQILKGHNVSVPRYVGLITVRIPENIVEILLRSNVSHVGKKFLINELEMLDGLNFWGLVIENIESDSKIINSKAAKAAYQTEAEKIDNLGIKIKDSQQSHNMLYSKKRNKVYLIDFEAWHFPINYGVKSFGWKGAIYSEIRFKKQS